MVDAERNDLGHLAQVLSGGGEEDRVFGSIQDA
jgi:hypothetical protein